MWGRHLRYHQICGVDVALETSTASSGVAVCRTQRQNMTPAHIASPKEILQVMQVFRDNILHIHYYFLLPMLLYITFIV